MARRWWVQRIFAPANIVEDSAVNIDSILDANNCDYDSDSEFLVTTGSVFNNRNNTLMMV
jgi:hypothetical protein